MFLLAVTLAQRIPSRRRRADYSLDAPRLRRRRACSHLFVAARSRDPAWVLPLMLLAGAVAFFQEVLWTRMLAHVVGSSIYAFGVMVASFLTGIALGGGAGALLARNPGRASHRAGCAR